MSIVLLMDSADGTLVAVAVGFWGATLALWGTERKRTEIFGHAFLFAALAYYASGLIAQLVLSFLKHKVDRQMVAFTISGFGGSILGPWLKDSAPKWLNKKAGLEEDDH